MLSAGTGSFYCGTCLRDDTLARGLRELGHEVRLIPLYLPLISDHEAGVSEDERVLLGGVNAYMQQYSALCRALPDWVDRALDSPLVLKLAAGRAGATNPSELGPMTRSMLLGSEGFQAKSIRRLCEGLVSLNFEPDVLLLSNALLLGLAKPLREALGCPVVSTLQGEDAFLDALPEGESAEAWTICRERAEELNHFIAVSAYHREVMQARLHLDEGRIDVVHNGIELEDFEPAEHPPERPTLGFFARLCEDKGLNFLVEAYIALRATWSGPPPKLLLGGAMTRLDKKVLGAACRRLSEAGVADALEVHPNMSRAEKIHFLRRLSLLCVPVRVSESFGLYALEAMASGVPIVAPPRGGLRELVERTGGGVLAGDETPDELAESIANLLKEPERARALGARGRSAVLSEFSHQHMARKVSDCLQRLIA